MSDILTRVTLPNSKYNGHMSWGRLTAKEAIEKARITALYNRDEAEACLNALDSDFQVDIVRGSIVENPVSTLQVARVRRDSSNKINQKSQSC
jgi:hypothetical protein